MINRLAFFIILLILAAAGADGSADPDDIKSRQSELARLRQEIQLYENRIKEQEKTETATLDLIDEYDKQITLVRKLVRSLHDQEQTLELDIEKTRSQMHELGGELAHLKRQYANYVCSMYKSGRTYDLELILGSKSLNQALIRSEYLRRFSEQRKRDADHIVSRRDDVEEDNLQLQKQLVQQRQLLSEKADEERTLGGKLKKRQQMLAEIRRDKKTLRREMSRTTAAAQDLEQLIAKLVEQERLRKEREAARARESGKPVPPPSPAITGRPFNQKRGHMRWPVDQGKVVARFGNQQHPILHTITQNTGIDISLPVGSNVTATSDGEISAISWLPSFGNLVIIDHSNGYRTVYAHLSEITVTEGQRVGEGAVIGQSGEALTGPMLHFEVWKDREKQDPETWLIPHGLARR